MAYLLSDKFKPSILKLAHSIFLDMVETQIQLTNLIQFTRTQFILV